MPELAAAKEEGAPWGDDVPCGRQADGWGWEDPVEKAQSLPLGTA